MVQFASITRKASTRRRSAFCPRPESLEGRRLLAAGALDLSFSADGWTAVSPAADPAESLPDFAYDAFVLDGGKVLVAGQTEGKYGLVRFLDNGDLDPSFGVGGRVRTDLSSLQTYGDAALQADGKIVVVGTIDNGSYVATGKGRQTYLRNYDLAMVRYNADGSLDSSFGTGGIVKTNVSTYATGDSWNRWDDVNGVAVQADGQIIVTGETLVGPDDHDAFLVRYTATGALDTAFGSGGKVVTSSSTAFKGVAVQADGKIVVRGGAGAELTRFNADGTLDTGFGAGGFVASSVLTYGNTWASRVLIQPDGKILAQGTASDGQNDDIGLLRVLADGTPDPDFGTSGDGTVRIDLGGHERSGGLALAPDGSVLVAGHQANASNDSLIARLTPRGMRDPDFAPGGVVVRSFSSSRDEFAAVAVDTDGRIVTVGTYTRVFKNGSEVDFLVARFQGASAPLLAASASTVRLKQTLTPAQARPVLAQALALWRAGGADPSRLGRIDMVIADLGGDRLGEASGSTITLDDDAAGWGWSLGRGRKSPAGRMDLLSAVAHEVGHLLGHDHAEGGVMAETLAPGVRQLPADRAMTAPLPDIATGQSSLPLKAFWGLGRRNRAAARG